MTEQLMQSLEVLFATFPPLSGAETEAGAALAMRAYLVAVKEFDPADIAAGVELIVSGKFPEHDGRYCPTAPQLARAVAKVRNSRLESERRVQKPALPPADIVHSPESRERVRKLAAEHIAHLASLKRTEDASKVAERKRWQDRMDNRFVPDQDERSMAERLGYEVGDPDGEEYAA